MDQREVRMFIIRALARADGYPLPLTTVQDSVRLAFPHLKDWRAAADQALGTLESLGYVLRGTAEITDDTILALSDRGRLQAQRLA